jgi:hypothetical protein
MIAADSAAPATTTLAASPPALAGNSPARAATLALVRVFVCEADEHAPALAKYFEHAGHPFVARGAEFLPVPVRDRNPSGRVFELFTLPLNLRAIVESHDRQEMRDLDVVLDLSDLPLLMVIRKGRPANSLHPEQELRGILDLLPTWRPDGPAGAANPTPSASPQTRPLSFPQSPVRIPFA